MKKIAIFCIFMALSASSFAQEEKWSNEPNNGKNKFQRINANAEKLSELISEVKALRSELNALKSQVAAISAGAASGGGGVQLTPPENQ